MSSRAALLCVAVGVAVAGGAFALGRASVDTDTKAARAAGEAAGRKAGFREGRVAGEAAGQAAGLRAGQAIGLSDGRAIGLRDGRAAGIREGRALQQPAPTRKAFRAGYTAGANDVFGGFDGGWAFGQPYVITLRRGSGGITYLIDTRSKAP